MKLSTGRNRRVIAAFGVGLLVAGFFVHNALAASTQLYLSPASGSVTQDNNVAVSVRVGHGGSDESNAVQANLSYPTDKFQFVSTSLGSAYEIAAENTGGGGSVRIGLGSVDNVAGDQLVATVTFKALAGSGTGSITFAGDSDVVNTGVSVLAGTSGATYSFTTPPANPAPSSPAAPSNNPVSSNSSKPSTSTKPSASTPVATQSAPSADKTGPQISNIHTSSITYNGATIEWDTNEAAAGVVDYGPTSSYGVVASGGAATQKHSVPLDSALLKAGTTYHFRVTSIDAAGNQTASEDQTVRTRGYTVQVKVVDAAGVPLKDAKVGLSDVHKTSDAQGLVLFTDMPLGQQTITVEVKGASIVKSGINIEASVKDGQPQTQTHEVRVGRNPSSPSWVIPAVIVGGILLLAGTGFAYWYFFKREGFPIKPGAVDGGPAYPTSPLGAGPAPQNPIDTVPKPDLPGSGAVINPNKKEHP